MHTYVCSKWVRIVNSHFPEQVIAEDFMDKKMEVTKFSQKHKEQRKVS